MKNDPSRGNIRMICRLYGDRYDDREEDSRPGGESWIPGQKARHNREVEECPVRGVMRFRFGGAVLVLYPVLRKMRKAGRIGAAEENRVSAEWRWGGGEDDE